MLYAVFFNALYTIFNPFLLYKRIKQSLLRKGSSLYDRSKLFQYEVNEIFENFEFYTSAVTSYSFKTLSLAFFYMPIAPYGLILGIIEIILNYYAWKW